MSRRWRRGTAAASRPSSCSRTDRARPPSPPPRGRRPPACGRRCIPGRPPRRTPARSSGRCRVSRRSRAPSCLRRRTGPASGSPFGAKDSRAGARRGRAVAKGGGEPLGTLKRTHMHSLEGVALANKDYVAEQYRRYQADPTSLGELIEHLRQTYCGTLGVEYLHIPDKEQRDWLQDRMEPTENRPELAPEDRIRLLESLLQAEAFEQFLQVRYPTAKRFSLEGGEALVPMLDALIEEGGTLGADEMVFGMPHRGRLNVLANVIRKPYEMILSEFEGTLLAREATGDGDVKYHLGYSRDHVTRAGHKVHLSLSANPSHLEAVDPVIEGIVRAKQDHYGDRERERVVPVLLHGDAAFNGQGVAPETLGLSEPPGYHVGGTIHIIVDNQIGFTTPPGAYRFTRYPSDVTKIILAPVFHVNGDDPEAAMQAARLAIGFRQRFKKDAVINLVCYRRHGHNELDDPTFTQPLMYKAIAAHPTVFAQYRERLVSDGAVAADDIERRVADFREPLDAAPGYARHFMPRQPVFAFGGLWKGLGWAGDDWSAATAVPAAALRDVAGAFPRLPPPFTPHPRAARLMQERAQMVEEGKRID